MPSLSQFSFCLFVWSSYGFWSYSLFCIFVFYFYIISILLLSLRSLFFLIKDRKEVLLFYTIQVRKLSDQDPKGCLAENQPVSKSDVLGMDVHHHFWLQILSDLLFCWILFHNFILGKCLGPNNIKQFLLFSGVVQVYL